MKIRDLYNKYSKAIAIGMVVAFLVSFVDIPFYFTIVISVTLGVFIGYLFHND